MEIEGREIEGREIEGGKLKELREGTVRSPSFLSLSSLPLFLLLLFLLLSSADSSHCALTRQDEAAPGRNDGHQLRLVLFNRPRTGGLFDFRRTKSPSYDTPT